MKIKFLIFFIVIFAAGILCAQQNLPQYAGYVNDFTGILSGQDKAKLEALLSELERKTTAQVAVVSVGTIEPLDIETYAVELFEKWGIGQKGKDNGVLLLIALNDRKLRIEVGYGLEGAIPDALAKQIISAVIVPSFREGNYSKGVMEGTLAITQLVAKEYNVELAGFEGLPAVAVPGEVSPLLTALRLLSTFIFFILIFGLRSGLLWGLIFMPGGTHRRGGYWHGSGYGGSSGGFSGGFGGFGGGFSGGGGASGGW